MAGKRHNHQALLVHQTQTIHHPRSTKKFLPTAIVSRIMKKSLPAKANISKEAKEMDPRIVSKFISFVTREASDKCPREKRKTINRDDLCWATTILGFEIYIGPLKVYLSKYRETEGDKNNLSSNISNTNFPLES